MLRKKIFINTAVNSGGKLLSFALQIFIMTYLIKVLGKDSYGVVVLALALVANTNILEAGFGLSVTKYVAEYKARGDWPRLLQTINTNLVISTIMGIVMCSILTLINEVFLEKIFTIPSELVPGAKNMIRALILLSVVEFWSVSLIRVAEGLQKFALARSMELVKWFLRAVFVLIAVYAGYGLAGIGAAYLAAGILSLVVVYIKVIMQDPELRLSISLSSKESFKQLFGFSIWIFLSKAFAFISYKIDTIVIAIFLPPANLAYYSIAFKVYEILSYGINLISYAIMPVTSELQAADNRTKLRLLFHKSSRYTLMFMFPILAFSFLYVFQVIEFWVGEDFGISVMLAQMFIISLFFVALSSSGAVMMIGLNRVKELVVYAGAGSLVNLTVSIVMVKEIGVKGVLVGTLVGSVIIASGYLYRMLRLFEYPFLLFLKDILGWPLTGAAILGSVLSALPGNFYIGVSVTLIYMALSVLLFSDRDDIRAIMNRRDRDIKFSS
ncbi:MAG: hypothetical protein C4526_06930 [Nitrospiraceae bacterium]|nr:MAG: hypothetical protein C4526_06930 [Nitrospiraceae bacterium]